MCDEVNLAYLQDQFPLLGEVRDVLEVGSYNVNGNCRQFIEDRRLTYVGLDLRSGPDVDVVCDITGPLDDLARVLDGRQFDLVICMNVLEHLYQPLAALENMCSLTRHGGYLMIVTPAVWDLHDWPQDYCRLNPDFFRRFASEAGIEIMEKSFVYSSRDNARFFPDASVLPMIVPHMHGSVFARAFRRALGLFAPEARETWTRLCLNLVLRKPDS